MAPVRPGELDGLPEGAPFLEPLGLGVEGGEVRLVEGGGRGLGIEDGDLRGDVGGHAFGDPRRTGHGRAAGQVALLLGHEGGDPAAEQQHGDGRRDRERDEGPTVAAVQPGLAGEAGGGFIPGGHATGTRTAPLPRMLPGVRFRGP